MENRLSHAVIPRYHYICTYDAALQATIAPYASWPSATGTPYAAAGTPDGNCTAAVVTGDTEGNTEVESLPVLWRSCSGMRGVWLQQARPKAVLLPSQHGFCDTSLVAAPLQGQVRAAASTAREPQQQHAQCRKGLALLPFASRPRHTPGTYHAVCLDHRGRRRNHASRRATGAVYQRALGQARQSPP